MKNLFMSKVNCNVMCKGQCVVLDFSKGEDDVIGFKEIFDDFDFWKLFCVLQLFCFLYLCDIFFGNVWEYGEYRVVC